MKLLRTYLGHHRDSAITMGSTSVLTISVIVIAGHLTGWMRLATWFGTSDMAPLSAVCFAIISVVLMSMHSKDLDAK